MVNNIRLAKTEDAQKILEVSHAAFAEYVRIVGLKQDFAALTETVDQVVADIKKKLVFVAENNSTIVASVRIEVFPDKTAYLSRFCTHPNCQGSGVGRAILDAVDAYLLKERITKITLHTASTHSSLVRFYYTAGYYIDEINKDRGYVRARLVKDLRLESK